MKKRDWFLIICDSWLVIDALLGILSGNPSAIDYINLAFAGILLLIYGIGWCQKEIEIRKKIKEIRKRREEQEEKKD